jgi:YHS domain-containing protein
MKYLLVLAAGGLILAGCAGSQGEYSEVTHAWKSNQGSYALDHVSNKKVEISKAAKRDYLGETYYFENEENARKFDSNPWSYLYDHNNPEYSGSLGSQNNQD